MQPFAFSECEDGPLGGCPASLQPFGDPAPRIDAGKLAPGGDAQFDSGAVGEASFDLRVRRVDVTATLHAAEDCGVTCLESVGIALTAQQQFDGSTQVQPLVGLMLAGSDNRVRLVVGGEVIAQWPLSDDPDGTQARWQLLVRPTGRVGVWRGDEALDVPDHVRVRRVRDARLVLYGRNRQTGPGARVSEVQIRQSLCDIPEVWNTREPLSLRSDGSEAELRGVRHPSVARNGTDTWLAFEYDGRVRLALQQSGEPTRFALRPGPALELADDGKRAVQPALVYDRNASRWALFYVAEPQQGEARLMRATTEDPEAGFGSGQPLNLGSDGFAYERLDMPTVKIHQESDGGRLWVMIARATGPNDVRELVALVSSDGLDWTVVTNGDLGVHAASDSNVGVGAGADELASPSLVIHNGAWRLYYAVRQGTEWRIGLLASDELLWWREVGDALKPDDSGFDQLSASEPSVLTSGNQVRLYYVGHDGVRRRLGRAVRLAPTDGRFL
jgi:hypothetical protein